MKKKWLVIGLVLVLVGGICGCSLKKEEVSREEVEKIVDEELYVLWNKNKISEVTNNELLTLGLEKVAKDKGLDSRHNLEIVSKKELEESFKRTSLGNKTIKHETVKGSVKVHTCEHDDWVYDAVKEEYRNETLGHGIGGVFEIFKKLEDFKENKGQYVATYKYAFTYSTEGDLVTVYGNFEDAQIQREDKVLMEQNSYDEDIKKKIEDNYESLKSKMATYTYTFEKVDGQIRLEDFKRS